MKTIIPTAALFGFCFAATACSGGDSDEVDSETGGATQGTGGVGEGTGGTADSSGGADAGTGGAESGTGGATDATGGASDGTGGTSDGTGGSDTTDEWVPGDLLSGTSAQICEIQIACEYQFVGQTDCVALFDVFFDQPRIDECYTCLVENDDCDTQAEICIMACSI